MKSLYNYILEFLNDDVKVTEVIENINYAVKHDYPVYCFINKNNKFSQYTLKNDIKDLYKKYNIEEIVSGTIEDANDIWPSDIINAINKQLASEDIDKGRVSNNSICYEFIGPDNGGNRYKTYIYLFVLLA